MEPNDLWTLFQATGDPMAYLWYKAMSKEEPK